MISPIITPVRFYKDLYQSDRFSTDCDICDYQLITDKTRLLPFQFRRPKSGYTVSQVFLRKECQDTFTRLIDSNASLFIIDTGFWSFTNFVFLNSMIKSTGLVSQFDKIFIFQLGKTYEIKIVVNQIVQLNPFTITANIGSNQLDISSVGTYYYRFTATALDEDFSIVTAFTGIGDYVIIENVEINQFQPYQLLLDDVLLENSIIQLKNIDLETDILLYCGEALSAQLPCGNYYLVIQTADLELYYSELITVKDFIPSQSPYTLLEWRNSCDIGDTIYSSAFRCEYKNRLYIDAELTKASYPFIEEGEQDGNQNLNITFQKWQKKQSIIVSKAPEFITDSLTAIRFHDEVTVTKSLRKKQFAVSDSYTVERVESELSLVFNDCAQNVELQFLLNDKIVDSNCCNNKALPSCLTCTINVTGMDVEVVTTGEYYFGTKDGDFGLFIKTDIGYDVASSVGQIVCIPGELPWFHLNEEYWTQNPSFATSTVEDATKYHIAGYAYEDTFVKITITFYDEFDTQISQYISGNYTAAQLLAGFDILKSDASFPCPFIGYAIITISSFALNCDYGMSEELRFDYEMHPLIETWYNALVGAKPSCELMFDLSQLVEGLDTDENLNEMDLIHVMAGMETDEQRLLPLFTSSGTPFSTVNTVTLDANGVKGNGTDSYIDTNWNIAGNAVNYTQDDCSILIKSKHPTGYTGMAIGSSESTTNCKSCIGLGILGAFNLNSNNTILIGTGINNMLSSVIRNASTDFNGKFGTNPVVTFADVSINPVNMTNTMTIGALNTDSGITDYSPATYQFVYIGSGIVDHTDINTRLNAYLVARGVA